MPHVSVLHHTIRLGISIIALSLLLIGCGDGSYSPPLPTAASTDTTAVANVSAGSTPYISFVDLNSIDISTINSIEYLIHPKAGTFSKPVSVRFNTGYLTRNGYSFPGAKFVRVPIFGLYSNYSNLVDIFLKFNDGSMRQLPTVPVTTSNYSGSSSLYTTPVIHVARSASDNLGFSFFYMKNKIGTPVIVDTDGDVRWLGAGSLASVSSAWYQNGFIVGQTGSTITRYELDGRIATSYLTEPRYLNFHHTIDLGPLGLLGEFDQTLKIESTLAEFEPSGIVLKEWDIAQIISDYMSANGDDPSTFVIPGSDWFHNNAATYDPRDKSLILSSRENFLIKIDYATSQIVWIFGDPTKYWYTFPSLSAKALTLTSGLYPIGQHAVSITPQGNLQIFNNGFQSINQPLTAPAGDYRSYSTVSTYAINETNRTATEVSQFDYGKSILSNICSSAYTEADGSILISYAVAAAGTATPVAAPNPFSYGNTARLVGLDSASNVSFDFEFPTNLCDTSFNANVIRLESLNFN
jgi:hypothetical protein